MGPNLKNGIAKMRAKFPDVVLLLQMGDYYAAYDKDANIVGEFTGGTTELDGEKVAFFPCGDINRYLRELLRTGRRVAIWAQLGKPLPRI